MAKIYQVSGGTMKECGDQLPARNSRYVRWTEYDKLAFDNAQLREVITEIATKRTRSLESRDELDFAIAKAGAVLSMLGEKGATGQ